MAARRTFLTVIVGAVAGCVGPGDSNRGLDGDESGDGESGSDDDQSGTAESDTEGEPGIHLRAAPVETGDREPVLSTDDEAVARIEPLVELLEEVTETFEVTYASLPPDDAEAFEALTAEVQRYPAGNPPGYYIDHDGTVVSVSRRG
jgi:hypothetical protein